MYQAASCSCSRGSAPSAALGRLEDGAPAPHEHLRRGKSALCSRLREGEAHRRLCTHARGGVPPHRCLRHLEDGAPAPRECLRRE